MKMRMIYLLYTILVIALVASENGWWKSGIIYQIYPRSFKDSNRDGIGDLNGIRQKLKYLKETGVDVLCLTPIYLSPMYDYGRDISDYRVIAPEYGTMEDFEKLLKNAKALGLQIIMDFLPNHTSNESEWFLKSVRREPGYENYYIWADGKPDPNNEKELLPPSNWLNIYGKSAWEYNAQRGQFYLHQFDVSQPELNYREPNVQEEIENVLLFWMDKGISGFNVYDVDMLYEVDPQKYEDIYPDEPTLGEQTYNSVPDDYESLKHIYTKNQNESYDLVYDWRDLLNEYTKVHGEYKILLTKSKNTDLKSIMDFYGDGEREGSIPINLNLLRHVTNASDARDIKIVIDYWMTYMPIGKIANWVNGNHDNSRLASRLVKSKVDAMNMIALLLPGLAVTYQGEEIGMKDGYISREYTRDPLILDTNDPVESWEKSRDPFRTPFQWDSSANAGFSNTIRLTWLPVANNYKKLNLATQKKAFKSNYKFYKDVAKIKKKKAVVAGDLDLRVLSETVLVISRLLPMERGIVGIVNLSNKQQTIDLSAIRLLPRQLKVVACGVDCKHRKGHALLKTRITIAGHCALVLESAFVVPHIYV